MPNFVGRWPNGDVVLSVGMSKRELHECLDEEANPGDCALTEIGPALLFEWTQDRACAHGLHHDFVRVRGGGGEQLPRSAPFSDVTLVGGDGGAHKAHRVILTARCPGLASLLDEVAPAGGRVVVSGLSGTALDALLTAVYADAKMLGSEANPWNRHRNRDTGSTCPEEVARDLLVFAGSHQDARLLEPSEPRLKSRMRALRS